MERRSLRRAVVAAATIAVLSGITAYADTIPADGDAVAPGNQTLVMLPPASPGQVVTRKVDFNLTCAGLSHAAPGATIQLDLAGTTVPTGGDATATSSSIGPVPDSWTPTGQGCDFPAPTLASDAPSTVTLTMPTTPGNGYEFTIQWSRTGAGGLTSLTAITYQVDVVGNTPPTIHLPIGLSAEATSSAGAAVTWSATATDNEDATALTPTCDRDPGSTFALGITTVHCSVTDGGGLTDSGSFLVTVSDTTAPKLAGMPKDRTVTTGDPAGAVVSYASPTATDAADPSPNVGCDPASGSRFPVGTTTVICTAQDATGNHASSSFDVSVVYVRPVAWTAVWGEPVATTGSTFVANSGRTIPVKVELFADGVEQTRGDSRLAFATCAGAAAGSIALTWDGGRWTGHLDTSTLGGSGCYVATASLDGNTAGAFRIDLRGADGTPASPKAKPKG